METEGLEQVIPGIQSIESALNVYRTFPCYNYAKNDITPKVLAIEIKRIVKKAKPQVGGKRKAAESIKKPDKQPNVERIQNEAQRKEGASSSISSATTPNSDSSGKLGKLL